MRSAIGQLELDDILHMRAKINAEILANLEVAADPWGLEVLRYEITEVSPDVEIQRAMDKQAVAERDRREQVLSAEGNKRSEVLQSEGIKLRKQNESEGELIKVRNEAQAMKERLILEATGKAEATLLQANAQAEAIRVVAEAMKAEGGMNAAQLELARDYVSMYGEMGSTSNTMIFSDKPGDMNSLVAQAAAVFSSTNQMLPERQ